MKTHVLVILFLCCTSSWAAYAQTVVDGRYQIVSRHSGLSLQVESASSANGANVVQWQYQGAPHQQFDIAAVGGGYYSIRAVHSGRSLDVWEMSTEPGGEIRQWDYWGGNNQQWQIVNVGGEYFKIVSRHSGLALDVWNWSSSNGGDIRQWSDTGGTNQQWTLQLAESSSSSSSSSSSPSGGLTARPDNTDCIASNFAEDASIQLQRVVPNLTFNLPVFYLPHPSEEHIAYVLEQRGIIYRVNQATNSRQQLVNLTDFYTFDNRCYECGLMGMAFDPDFINNGYIYLSFVQGGPGNWVSYVARFTTQDNGVTLDRSGNTLSRFDLLSVPQPYNIHNGGHIAFGNDGYLYLGLGDGGPANDAQNNAQTVTNVLGSMLRITTQGEPAPGNSVTGALPEIYAYGLRNPWRWSFDRETDELWLADVGERDLEEINIIENGGNYGWRCYEGTLRTNNACTTSGPYIEPVATYGRGEGISVTGGYVYRGGAIPALYGVYVFGDFGSGRIWGLFPDGEGGYDRQLLLASGRSIVSFGEDRDGELYVVDHNGGIYQIIPDASVGASGPPQNLSDTGCVDPNNPTEPAEGLIPYDLNEPFWSDGAVKTRFVALPNNAEITVGVDGNFEFPVDTVLVKKFRLEGRLIETRLFMHAQEGVWKGYSYRWDSTQTEATLLSGALDENIGAVTWHYPSRAECSVCHTPSAGFSLGPEAAQLNKDFTYPSTAVTANQLETWDAIGLFTSSLSAAQKALFIPSSADADYSVEDRTRSYLHSNCSNCHRPSGPTPVSLDLRFTTPLAQTGSCDAAPQMSDLGIDNARIIAPGDGDRSVLLQRMLATGEERMPTISSHVVDSDGAAVVGQWISQLVGCP